MPMAQESSWLDYCGGHLGQLPMDYDFTWKVLEIGISYFVQIYEMTGPSRKYKNNFVAMVTWLPWWNVRINAENARKLPFLEPGCHGNQDCIHINDNIFEWLNVGTYMCYAQNRSRSLI